jgi:tripartite-type tricarboxylate transporter receptor subunit TctC
VLAGKLAALAVTPGRRTPVWPELPTIAEAGLPGYAADSWFGFLAPAATPKDIIALLNRTLVALLGEPALINRLSAQGLEPTASTPDALAEHLRSEIAKWTPIVKASGARPE